MPGPALSIIVPTYREAENIPILAERLFAALAAAGLEGELVVVDDDSRDGTEEAVAKLAGRYPVRLVTRKGERGLSSAVLRGFDEARGKALLCMDADLSHPPEAAPAVAGPVLRGETQFAVGSRYVAGGRTEGDWGLLRRINSRGATLLARPLTRVADPMAGFFCLARAVLERARAAGLDPIGYKIALEILVKARCESVVEVPIAFADRLYGRSKLTLAEQWRYLRHLARLYRFRWPGLTRAVEVVALLSFVVALAGWVLAVAIR